MGQLSRAWLDPSPHGRTRHGPDVRMRINLQVDRGDLEDDDERFEQETDSKEENGEEDGEEDMDKREDVEQCTRDHRLCIAK
ncbi:hypothetical protein AX14_001803 [Amanita brunnescens Koide BX004]|nr:hypothetical protein AX14_001803 [Amanita brunnescens Koide BX004]